MIPPDSLFNWNSELYSLEDNLKALYEVVLQGKAKDRGKYLKVVCKALDDVIVESDKVDAEAESQPHLYVPYTPTVFKDISQVTSLDNSSNRFLHKMLYVLLGYSWVQANVRIRELAITFEARKTIVQELFEFLGKYHVRQ